MNMIAFDTGGTKTDAVLFTHEGEVLRRLVLPGANPLDVGFAGACRCFLDTIDQLRGGTAEPIECIYGAVACNEYFGDRIARHLSETLPKPRIRIESDGPCLISGMLGHADGACLICGTGAALITRQGEAVDHIGGWGYLIDSCGSGFILGKRAILAAVREADGRGPATLLTPLLAAKCGRPVVEHFEALYQRGRPYIAAMAETVFAARQQGDSVASAIFDDCVGDLAELVDTAARRFGGPFPLVLNGGVFCHFPEYAQALAHRASPQAQFILADVPPVYGGAVEAMHDMGLACSPAFRARFMEGYASADKN